MSGKVPRRLFQASRPSRRVAFCTHCGASAAQGGSFCASCGKPIAAGGPAPPPPAYAPAPAYGQAYDLPPPPPVSYQPARAVSEGMAIAALLLNVIVWPGLGSLVAGVQKGWAQGFLFLGGGVLTLTIVGAIIGIPMMIGAWIWGVVTGVHLIQGRPG